MASAIPGVVPVAPEVRRRARVRTITEPAPIRWTLIGLGLAFLGVVVLLPLWSVFSQALEGGVGQYFARLAGEETREAIQLTLLVAAIVVPLNTVFGVAAGWLIARYRFRGKNLLLSLIDVPFSVSPVISGLIFVLLFGARGVLGPWLQAHDIKIIFAVPGIVLATAFVTFPFVAREVLPGLQSQGADQEEAASTRGPAAGGSSFA